MMRFHEGKDVAGSEARAAAEAAREELRSYTTFAGSLFMGTVRWPLVWPWPPEDPEEERRAGEFLRGLEEFLVHETDPNEIDRRGEIPERVIEGLARIGAFGIRIPRRYGGLGLSQVAYSRAAMLLGSWCANLTALVSAHQSIGVSEPLLLFGTEEQRKRFLPRVARGEISAFALTESGVGSDPARMETTATATEDGKAFRLNGEKLWCTNGTRAGLVVVMARTRDDDSGRRRFTAFVVETDRPGFEVVHRCRFMGLRALMNGVIRLNDVEVPRENVVGEEGHGLRVALTTLNTGRLTLPAACVGAARSALAVARRWANERTQWGSPIGRHAMIAEKLARMATDLFAMESMVLLTSGLVDQGVADVRLEAAMSKLWASEALWRIINDAVQIRGGRGYETAASLAARGEWSPPVERWLRDSRINTIFEGSSEILRLFLAREALDPHLTAAGALLDPGIMGPARWKAAFRAGRFYARWYPRQWVPVGSRPPAMHPRLARHARYVVRTSRRLARRIFAGMVRNGAALEKRQLLLARYVDAGTELFAIASVLLHAEGLKRDEERSGPVRDLADHFSRRSRIRVKESFSSLRRNEDRPGYRMAQEVLGGRYDFLCRERVREPESR